MIALLVPEGEKFKGLNAEKGHISADCDEKADVRCPQRFTEEEISRPRKVRLRSHVWTETVVRTMV